MGINIEKYSNISKREFEVEIITPLFLGGADKVNSEIRAASIKGALRFWWRALYGYKFNSIEEMAHKENKIFGSTENKSSFSIMVDENLESILKNLDKGKTFKAESKGKVFYLGIIDYLTIGLHKPNKKVKRKLEYIKKYFKDKQKFNLTLTFYNQNYRDEILNSFYALIKYGSLGAKARNGFGSLYVKDLPSVDIKNDKDTLDFTAFSSKSKLFIGTEQNSWEDALSEIGMIYKDARLSKDIEKKHSFDKRALIAMPIESKFEEIPSYIRKGRHTKPYFLHVNKLSNGKYQGQILFLPYNYNSNTKSPNKKPNHEVKGEKEEYNQVHETMCKYFAEKLQEVEL